LADLHAGRHEGFATRPIGVDPVDGPASGAAIDDLTGRARRPAALQAAEAVE
jgi:hypothetical protein